MVRVFAILFIVIVSCSAARAAGTDSVLKTDNSGHIIVLEYGKSPADSYERQQIAHKYHFSFVNVGGCLISVELGDSVEKNNRAADSALKHLNGPGWQKRYEKDVATAYKRNIKMEDAVLNYPPVKKVCDGKMAAGYQIKCVIDSELNNNIFIINVLGLKPDPFSVTSFFRVKMDYNHLSVIKVDDEIKPIDILN
jgi:hypothetical protein